jgi:hypothetical protein
MTWNIDNPKDKGVQPDPLTQVTAMAQRDANRHGVPMAVLNLNTVGRATYVCRVYHPNMQEGHYAHQFVAKIDPND